MPAGQPAGAFLFDTGMNENGRAARLGRASSEE